MDIALAKAHELGYDEHKPRLKETRINTPIVNKPQSSSFINLNNFSSFQIPIKEESLESTPNPPQLQSRNRPPPSETPNLQSPNVS